MIPRLHLVTDDEILLREGFPEMAKRVLEAGGSGVALHVRGPRTSGRSIHSLGGVLAGAADRSGAVLLINDRLDVALTLPGVGAQLGQRSLPPEVARRLLGEERLLGLSVHGMAELRSAPPQQVDFFLLGNLFATSSHPDREPLGLDALRGIADDCPLPLLAIGGISPERVRRVLDAGARGVAVRSGIWNATDPPSAVGEYLEALEEAR